MKNVFIKTGKIAIVLALLSGSITSCKKYLDINTSPITATKVDPKLLFGYAIVAWNTSKNSGDGYIPMAFIAQTIASGGNYGFGKQNLYNGENLNPFALDNTWRMYYSTAGNNLQLAIKAATDKNTIAQCKTVLAELMYECTTTFGDIPFSESWAGISYPKFDSQKDVFEGILKLLDDAIANFDVTSSLKITDYDIYYGGDIAKWKKLANSLKLKVLMTMVDKDPTKAAAIAQLAQNPTTLIASPAESWLHKYSTVANNENPKYRFDKQYGAGLNLFFFANKNVMDYMKPKNDPRIPQYFEMGPAATDYIPVETEEEANDQTALISNYLYRPEAPDVLCSYQEISLILAEIYTRTDLGVRDLTKANTYFKQGVQAAMNFYQADPTAINTYITTQLADLTTAGDPLREIHIQQWIDFMDRPIDAFILWRRSGPMGNEFPSLTLPLGATAGPLIRRWPYSPGEASANPNTPNPAPQYYDKVWFDL